MRIVWLCLALLPYAALAGFDGFLHERSRRVPKLEQWLHAGSAISIVVFIVAVFRAQTMLAIVAFCIFAPIAATDEFGYHAQLAARERYVHFASYVALCIFACIGLWPEVAR
jgi:hypothetical protein